MNIDSLWNIFHPKLSLLSATITVPLSGFTTVMLPSWVSTYCWVGGGGGGESEKLVSKWLGYLEHGQKCCSWVNHTQDNKPTHCSSVKHLHSPAFFFQFLWCQLRSFKMEQTVEDQLQLCSITCHESMKMSILLASSFPYQISLHHIYLKFHISLPTMTYFLPPMPTLPSGASPCPAWHQETSRILTSL